MGVVNLKLTEEDYSALSLWCVVNSDSRRSFATNAVTRSIKNKIDNSALKKRLKSILQEEWNKKKDKDGWNMTNIISKFNDFKADKRIELCGESISKDLVNEILNSLIR